MAYSSLALCSEINDISSNVKGNFSADSLYFSGNGSTYQLPSGLTINDHRGQILATQVTSFVHDMIPKLENENHPLLTLELLSYNTIARECQDCRSENEPFAASVNLYPCIQQFGNVNVAGTVWQRELVSSRFLNGNTLLGYKMVGSVSSRHGADCAPSSQPTPVKTHGILTREPHDGGPATQCDLGSGCPCCEDPDSSVHAYATYYDPACVFTMGRGSTMGLVETFQDFFGSLGNPQPKYLTLQHSKNPLILNGDNWIQPFWHQGSQNLSLVKGTIRGMLDSMNAVIATDGDPTNSAPATGTVLGNETCIRAAWMWLTYPIVLLALACAFLGFTVFESCGVTSIGGSEAGRGPWKSSSSPLLWCGVQDCTKEKHGSIDVVQEMGDRGDHTYVSLGRYDTVTNAVGRWVLREHTPAPVAVSPSHGSFIDSWSLRTKRLVSFLLPTKTLRTNKSPG